MAALSLRVKVAAAMTLVMLVVVGVGTGLRVAWTARLMDEARRSEAATTARLLARGCADALLTQNQVALFECVRPAPGGSVVYASVEDREGVVVAHTDVRRVGTRDGSAEAGSVFEVSAPIEAGGERWGRVRLGVSQERFLQSLARARTEAILHAVLAVLLSASVAAGLGWLLTRRLQALTEATRALARGDFARRVAPGARDEIGQLGRAFNAMAEQLAASYARLEQAVAERTAHLRALVDAGLTLTSSLETDTILHDVVAAAARLIGGRSAVLRLISDDGRLLVRAAHGMSAEYLARSAVDLSSSPVSGAVLARRAAITVEDLADRPDLPLQPVLLAEGIRAMVVVPIATPARSLGVLTVHTATPHRFSSEEVSTLTLLAEQTAVALELARVFRESEERRVRLAEQAQELEAFTYTVSHDLKAPLRGMEGFARVLEEDYGDQLDEAGRRYVGLIQASARRMGQLIDDLLKYSRLERRELKREPVPLRPLLERICQELDADIRARGLTVRLALAVETVEAERDGLREALANLLENAVKFTPPGGGTVTVASAAGDGEVVLSVADHGIGFDMKYHDRIFQIFERLHRQEEYAGTGVGLAIVRKVAERHRGRAWAVSEPGKGSTFFLALPASAEGRP